MTADPHNLFLTRTTYRCSPPCGPSCQESDASGDYPDRQDGGQGSQARTAAARTAPSGGRGRQHRLVKASRRQAVIPVPHAVRQGYRPIPGRTSGDSAFRIDIPQRRPDVAR